MVNEHPTKVQRMASTKTTPLYKAFNYCRELLSRIKQKGRSYLVYLMGLRK